MTKLDYEPRRGREIRDGFPGWTNTSITVVSCGIASIAGAWIACEATWGYLSLALPCCGMTGALVFIAVGLGVAAMFYEAPMWVRHVVSATIAFCGTFAATFVVLTTF